MCLYRAIEWQKVRYCQNIRLKMHFLGNCEALGLLTCASVKLQLLLERELFQVTIVI